MLMTLSSIVLILAIDTLLAVKVPTEGCPALHTVLIFEGHHGC